MSERPPRSGRSRRSRDLDQRFAPPRASPPEEIRPAGPPRAPGGNEAVLVIEDQDAVREATRAILERLGYRVATARDGEEALRFVRQGHDVNLVLMDVVLPAMNGITLAERIVELRSGVRVLFMSGLTSETGVPERSSCGMPCGFLLKPFGVDVLARGVRDLLDREPDGLRAG